MLWISAELRGTLPSAEYCHLASHGSGMQGSSSMKRQRCSCRSDRGRLAGGQPNNSRQLVSWRAARGGGLRHSAHGPVPCFSLSAQLRWNGGGRRNARAHARTHDRARRRPTRKGGLTLTLCKLHHLIAIHWKFKQPNNCKCIS